MVTAQTVLNQYHFIDVDTQKIIREESKVIAPGHESDFETAIYNVIIAMDIGRSIYFNQYDPIAAQVINTLSEIYPEDEFADFIRSIEIAGGMHDYFSKVKIEPDFSKEKLAQIYQGMELCQDSLDLDVLTEILFNPDVYSHLPKNRNVYPAEVETDPTGKLVQKIKDNLEARLSFTKVGLGINGELTTERFNKVYEKEIIEISEHLNIAAYLLENIGESIVNDGFGLFATYLREIARSQVEMEGKFPFTDVDIALIKAYKSEQSAPFFAYLGFGSGYQDKLGIKGFYTSEIGIETKKTREMSSYVERFSDIDSLEKNIPYKLAIREQVDNIPIILEDIIFRTGAGYTGAQGIAVTFLPDEKKIVDEHGVVIAGWRNVLDAKGREILNPIAREILPESFIEKYDGSFDDLVAMSFVVGVMSHEQRHFIGDQMEREDLSAILGGNFNTINEGKAEIGRLYSYSDLVSEEFGKYSREDVLSFFQNAYFAEVIRHARTGNENPYGESAMLRLNYFIEHDAVTIDDDLKINIDADKLNVATENLYSLHLEIAQTGDAEKAKEYIETYTVKKDSKLDNQLKQIIKKLDDAKIPMDIVLNYKMGNIQAL